ncbi:MAG: hypothetical protein K2K57_09970 [Oscillospiraceae bacterium]|nr:hypothetical protein [Oscillospiraceae bacterium]
MDGILVIIYAIAGTIAVGYVKTNIFGVMAEFTTDDVFTHFVKKIITGVIFGWLAIPIAILHKLIFNRD